MRSTILQAAESLSSNFVPSTPLWLPPIPRPQRVPCLPFFRDPGHTVPTRRLYRALLRGTYRYPMGTGGQPGEGEHNLTPPQQQLGEALVGHSSVADSSRDGDRGRGLIGIRQRIIRDWRKGRQATSPNHTSAFLRFQADLLTRLTLTTSKQSSNGRAELLATNEAYLLTYTRYLARMAYERSRRTQPQPVAHMTGGFLRPTQFNPPLPRLKPQPIGISMMIHNRLRAKEQRYAKRQVYFEYSKDMAAEVEMWKMLGLAPMMDAPGGTGGKETRRMEQSQSRRDHAVSWEGSGWALGCKEMIKILDAPLDKEEARRTMKFSPELVKRVKKARSRRELYRREEAERRKAAQKEKMDGGG